MAKFKIIYNEAALLQDQYVEADEIEINESFIVFLKETPVRPGNPRDAEPKLFIHQQYIFKVERLPEE